ncbi:hypothetical protein PENTCL1PPCAC_26025, partial [Pristionchus entomophagus]
EVHRLCLITRRFHSLPSIHTKVRANRVENEPFQQQELVQSPLRETGIDHQQIYVTLPSERIIEEKRGDVDGSLEIRPISNESDSVELVEFVLLRL